LNPRQIRAAESTRVERHCLRDVARFFGTSRHQRTATQSSHPVRGSLRKRLPRRFFGTTSRVWRGFGSVPRASTRHPSCDLEPSGSSERPGVRRRAHPRTLRPFGALPTGSSEPRGSPHVRHGVLTRPAWSPGQAARPFGVGRRRPGGRAGCTGGVFATARAAGRLFGADGQCGV